MTNLPNKNVLLKLFEPNKKEEEKEEELLGIQDLRVTTNSQTFVPWKKQQAMGRNLKTWREGRPDGDNGCAS